MVKSMLTMEETAYLLNKDKSTVSNLIKSGKLQARRLPGHGKRLFIKKEDVERYLHDVVTFANIEKKIHEFLKSDTMTTQQLYDAFMALGGTEVEVDGVMQNVLRAKKRMLELREGAYVPVP